MRLFLIIFGILMFSWVNYMNGQADQTPKPPDAIKKITRDTLFGDVRTDPYYWLRERGNPEVIDYLKAENAYTEAMMKHTEGLQEKLYEEMRNRIKETDLSVPVKKGEYYYYTRTEEGKQYPIHCRKKGSLEAEEEVLLDENRLAEGHDYFNIGVFKVSPDHSLLAYSVDTSGSETYTIYIKHLKTNELLPDRISNTYYSVEWANDNKTLFYNILDEAKRPFKLYKHRLGTPQDEDPLVYHEKDDKYFLRLSRTRSERYLLLQLNSKITSEVRYLDADQPQGRFKILQERQPEVEYYVDHRGDYFYIYTNHDAVNFKLMRAPVTKPQMANWETVLPHRENIMIDGIDLFKEYLVVYERQEGLKQMRITELKTNDTHYVAFEEPLYTFSPNSNPEFDSQILRFTYMSLKTPNTVYDYDMQSGERELLKQKEVLGGYSPDDYVMERISAKAEDGTDIPISLIYKKGLEKDGKNPLLLYGYGSYGYALDPYFSSNRFSLIDRGFVFAIAHIRGGGEMGRPWYEQGKLLQKKNTFTDFIACAEHLIAEKYTNSDLMAINGGSAGGLLMGTVVNMRPDLFQVVVAEVPFVDVINTMLDASIPLTVIEYDEWGNPNKETYYRYIKSYSPYDNVRRQEYPHMLITAGLNDPRVQYWEPAKWTAKLRDTKAGDNWLLLKTNMGAGHGGASGRYDYLKEEAFQYAFILDRLGIK